MAHAYTPGLRVTADTTIQKTRLLPLPGEVVVSEGDSVSATTVVARTELPGRVYPINIANRLSISPGDVSRYLLAREDERVTQGQVVAENRPWLKWFQTQVRAPVTGTIETVSHRTGQIFLREPPQVLDLGAYIAGQVTTVMPQHGVVVAARGALVQGICGVGGETHGPLTFGVETPEETLTAAHLTPEQRGHIVIGGAFVQPEAFARAREIGVHALIVGGVDAADLKALLGYDLGVAITGTEHIGCTLILTEGFGRMPMARRTFELFAAHSGRLASCSGATQIRAGVIRPEIVIPRPNAYKTFNTEAAVQGRHGAEAGIQVSDVVRIIREPYFGSLARVRALPPELRRIPTESTVRVLIAELPDGQEITIPRANVEMIEGEEDGTRD